MQVEKMISVPISELKAYKANARMHSKRQIQELANSLRTYGFVTPVLIDAERNIIAGHGRVEAAIAAGIETAPCVLVEHLSEDSVKAYRLADNRLAEKATWDMDVLAEELAALDLSGIDLKITGFAKRILLRKFRGGVRRIEKL